MKKLQPILKAERPPGIYRFTSWAKPQSVLTTLQEAGWQGFYIDGDEVEDKASFLRVGAAAMHFPGYFGSNWDAFEECITDLEWVPAQGYVLLYDKPARFARNQPDEWRMAYSILNDTVIEWRKSETPMYVLLRWTWWYVPNLEKL